MNSSGVHDDFRLVEIEVNRAAPPSRIVQDLKKLAHQVERGDERRIARQQLRIPVGQNAVHIGVGHPLVAVDDAVVKLVTHHHAAPIYFHQTALHQPVDVRIQTA
jgi:hypothetical protein